MKKRLFKLVVHVPPSHADAVREAIATAGGGEVGEYKCCSFTTHGTGRFMPTEKATPHIGTAGGGLETVEEESIEVSRIPIDRVKQVVDAMISAHPYEETDYQLTELFLVEDLV